MRRAATPASVAAPRTLTRARWSLAFDQRLRGIQGCGLGVHRRLDWPRHEELLHSGQFSTQGEGHLRARPQGPEQELPDRLDGARSDVEGEPGRRFERRYLEVRPDAPSRRTLDYLVHHAAPSQRPTR